MTDNRESGIDFGHLSEELETTEYPLSTDDLLDQYGDRTVSFSDGEAELDHLLDSAETTYESAEEVRQAILNMVGDGAIGRKDYSDRGTTHQDEDDEEAF